MTTDAPRSGGHATAPGAPAASARALGALAAATGCVLPWERLLASPPGDATERPLDGLHGLGVLSCAAAALAMLLVALLLARPDLEGRRADAATATLGLLIVAGSVLFPYVDGGYPPGSNAGDQSRVTVGPGLVATAAGGLVLLAVGLTRLASRRAGSRSPGSTGARRRR